MRRRALASSTLVALLSCAMSQPIADASHGTPLRRIGRGEFCVTNGVVSPLPDERLAVDTPSSRAVVRVVTDQTAELRFRYLGPTAASKPLASGELRRQIGLKLKAQDSCNLVYAMWHIEPDSKFAVSIKRNPEKHTHAQCHAGGYVTIRPERGIVLPQIQPGESHSLRADLRGTALTLLADDRVVWEGTLGNEVSTFDGPVGFRTDNARFDFEYYAGNAGAGSVRGAANPKCSSVPED